MKRDKKSTLMIRWLNLNELRSNINYLCGWPCSSHFYSDIVQQRQSGKIGHVSVRHSNKFVLTSHVIKKGVHAIVKHFKGEYTLSVCYWILIISFCNIFLKSLTLLLRPIFSVIVFLVFNFFRHFLHKLTTTLLVSSNIVIVLVFYIFAQVGIIRLQIKVTKGFQVFLNFDGKKRLQQFSELKKQDLELQAYFNFVFSQIYFGTHTC